MGETSFYLIEWQADGADWRNHYFAGQPPFELPTYLQCLKTAGMLELEGFESMCESQ